MVANGGKVQTLRETVWLYDGSVPCRVRLIREDWDEDVDLSADVDEEPLIFRTAYYVEYEVVASGGKFGRGALYGTEADALEDARGLLPGIQWDGR